MGKNLVFDNTLPGIVYNQKNKVKYLNYNNLSLNSFSEDLSIHKNFFLVGKDGYIYTKPKSIEDFQLFRSYLFGNDNANIIRESSNFYIHKKNGELYFLGNLYENEINPILIEENIQYVYKSTSWMRYNSSDNGSLHNLIYKKNDSTFGLIFFPYFYKQKLEDIENIKIEFDSKVEGIILRNDRDPRMGFFKDIIKSNHLNFMYFLTENGDIYMHQFYGNNMPNMVNISKNSSILIFQQNNNVDKIEKFLNLTKGSRSEKIIISYLYSYQNKKYIQIVAPNHFYTKYFSYNYEVDNNITSFTVEIKRSDVTILSKDWIFKIIHYDENKDDLIRGKNLVFDTSGINELENNSKFIKINYRKDNNIMHNVKYALATEIGALFVLKLDGSVSIRGNYRNIICEDINIFFDVKNIKKIVYSVRENFLVLLNEENIMLRIVSLKDELYYQEHKYIIDFSAPRDGGFLNFIPDFKKIIDEDIQFELAKNGLQVNEQNKKDMISDFINTKLFLFRDDLIHFDENMNPQFLSAIFDENGVINISSGDFENNSEPVKFSFKDVFVNFEDLYNQNQIGITSDRSYFWNKKENKILEFKEGWYYSNNSKTYLSNNVNNHPNIVNILIKDHQNQYNNKWFLYNNSLYYRYIENYNDDLENQYTNEQLIAENIKNYIKRIDLSGAFYLRYIIDSNNRLKTITDGYKPTLRLLFWEKDSEVKNFRSFIIKRTLFADLIILFIIIFLPKKFIGKIQLYAYYYLTKKFFPKLKPGIYNLLFFSILNINNNILKKNKIFSLLTKRFNNNIIIKKIQSSWFGKTTLNSLLTKNKKKFFCILISIILAYFKKKFINLSNSPNFILKFVNKANIYIQLNLIYLILLAFSLSKKNIKDFISIVSKKKLLLFLEDLKNKIISNIGIKGLIILVIKTLITFLIYFSFLTKNYFNYLYIDEEKNIHKRKFLNNFEKIDTVEGVPKSQFSGKTFYQLKEDNFSKVIIPTNIPFEDSPTKPLPFKVFINSEKKPYKILDLPGGASKGFYQLCLIFRLSCDLYKKEKNVQSSFINSFNALCGISIGGILVGLISVLPIAISNYFKIDQTYKNWVKWKISRNLIPETFKNVLIHKNLESDNTNQYSFIGEIFYSEYPYFKDNPMNEKEVIEIMNQFEKPYEYLSDNLINILNEKQVSWESIQLFFALFVAFEMINLIFEKKTNIGVSRPIYSESSPKVWLKDIFLDLRLNDIGNDLYIGSVNLTTKKMEVFSNQELNYNIPTIRTSRPYSNSVLLYEILSSTSAAPPFFRPNLNYIDGCFGTNSLSKFITINNKNTLGMQYFKTTTIELKENILTDDILKNNNIGVLLLAVVKNFLTNSEKKENDQINEYLFIVDKEGFTPLSNKYCKNMLDWALKTEI